MSRQWSAAIRERAEKQKRAFGDGFTRWFISWQLEQGDRRTIDDLARELGVPRPTVNAWLNGTRAPTGPSLERLASKIGGQVYDWLGLPPPDLEGRWSGMSEDQRRRIEDILRDTE